MLPCTNPQAFFFCHIGTGSKRKKHSAFNPLTLFIVFAVIWVFDSSNSWCMEHMLTESMGQKIFPSSFNPDALPGDKIIISANRKSPIVFKDFNGTSTRPFTFTNPKDSKVTITASGNTIGIQFLACDNFILRGNSYSGTTYGIEIKGGTTASGVRMGQCADWEISYLYIHHTGGGITQNGNEGPYAPWSEKNSMGDCRIHHCKIADTSATFAEGMYLGKSIEGDYPKWKSLEIYDNKIYRTGCEGIQAGQISTSGGRLKIHNNYIEAQV